MPLECPLKPRREVVRLRAVRPATGFPIGDSSLIRRWRVSNRTRTNDHLECVTRLRSRRAYLGVVPIFLADKARGTGPGGEKKREIPFTLRAVELSRPYARGTNPFYRSRSRAIFPLLLHARPERVSIRRVYRRSIDPQFRRTIREIIRFPVERPKFNVYRCFRAPKTPRTLVPRFTSLSAESETLAATLFPVLHARFGTWSSDLSFVECGSYFQSWGLI